MNNQTQEAGAVALGLCIVVAIIGFMIALYIVNMPGNVDKVRSGELDLICLMHDGERLIDRDKVIDFIDGVWIFKGGSAKNCRLVKGV